MRADAGGRADLRYAARPRGESGFRMVGGDLASGGGVGLRVGGPGVSGGAGVEYALSRSVSLDLGGIQTQGRFRTGDPDGDAYSSTRPNLGLRLRF